MHNAKIKQTTYDESEKITYDENKKQAILEYLWLTYYNDSLFSKGIITEEQRDKMRCIINCRLQSGKKKMTLAKSIKS